MQKSLGIIETYGLLAAVAVADAMVKSANVELIGYELSKGQGMAVIKVQGDVGAVKAALASGEAQAREMGLFCAMKLIPRPAANLEMLVFNSDTVGCPLKKEAVREEAVKEDTAPEQADGTGETQAVPKETPAEKQEATCNLCGDPACTRKAKQPKKLCIHYQDEES